ncbi:MAG: carbamate kinase [Halobacteriales archaeon]
MADELVVVALGGNTLLSSDDWTHEAETEAIEETAREIADVVESGRDVVLTHGNGPQVGDLMAKQDAAGGVRRPLDVLVAMTQAQIGYQLQRALDGALVDRGDYVSVVTQVEVDLDDPAFSRPTKPVGPYLTEAEARERGFEVERTRDERPRYRRVVPSPEPRDVVEKQEIAALLDAGVAVVCLGGGGVPVTEDDGVLRGAEAVVDKDRSTALLAAYLDADALVVLTDVEHACVDYGTESERALEEVTPSELRSHLEADEFAEGSMKPKIQALLDYHEATGGLAVSTEPGRLHKALDGEAGTRLLPDSES